MLQTLFTGVAPALIIAGPVHSSPALAQNSTEKTVLMCRYEGYESKWYIYSDKFVMPKAVTSYKSDGTTDDNRNLHVFLPEFKAHLEKQGFTRYQSDSFCGFWETEAKAEEWKQSDQQNKAKYGYVFKTILDWRPSNMVPPPPVAKTAQQPGASGKRDSIIVRSIDEPPAKPNAATSKPNSKAPTVAKPKPAMVAKPSPKNKAGCKSGDSARGKVCRAVAR